MENSELTMITHSTLGTLNEKLVRAVLYVSI
jgi:hypothetical protein